MLRFPPEPSWPSPPSREMMPWRTRNLTREASANRLNVLGRWPYNSRDLSRSTVVSLCQSVEHLFRVVATKVGTGVLHLCLCSHCSSIVDRCTLPMPVREKHCHEQRKIVQWVALLDIVELEKMGPAMSRKHCKLFLCGNATSMSALCDLSATPVTSMPNGRWTRKCDDAC